MLKVIKITKIFVFISLFLFLTFWFLYIVINNSYLVLEIIPEDQEELPIPEINDEIIAYGVWVNDQGHQIDTLGFTWNEIHPVRYLKILNKNIEGGENPYKGEIMHGVFNPERLKIIDEENPYKYVKGIVKDKFKAPDGDIHLRLEVKEEYLYLVRLKPFLPYIPILIVISFLFLFLYIFIISLLLYLLLKFIYLIK